MIFKRFFDPKLAQASYLIGCPTTREALVVDPNRHSAQYLQAAREEGLRVSHVAETHIHADFISGARELAHRAGARLVLSEAGGPEWCYGYTAQSAATLVTDSSSILVGTIRIDVLHLPGHTPEHVVFLVTDTRHTGTPMGAFTGDFLFVGDVGRPDLLEKAARLHGTMEHSARQLYRSVQRFRGLSDHLQIWPGHGAGSACGKSLSAVPQSTLGYEQRTNWAFTITDETTFVRAVLEGQPEPPPYFARMKRINQSGPQVLGDIRPAARLSEDTLRAALDSGNPVIDTRESSEYLRAAVPGSINIPANRSFTTWAGCLLPYDRDLYLIVGDAQTGSIDELLRDLAGVGLERIAGYYGPDAIDHWRGSGSLQGIPSLKLEDLVANHQDNGAMILDVRGEAEWKTGHIPGSVNVPLAELDQRLEDIRPRAPIVVHCQTGPRAAIAASVLRARGIDDVLLFPGGFAEWRTSGQPVET